MLYRNKINTLIKRITGKRTYEEMMREPPISWKRVLVLIVIGLLAGLIMGSL